MNLDSTLGHLRSRAALRWHMSAHSQRWMAYAKALAPAAGVFCLALLVRVVYNLTVAQGYVPQFDAAIYNNLAHSLLKDHCYCYAPGHPTAFRPPLWPYTIAAVYALFGDHVESVRMLCGILGSGTCVLVYFFAKDLFGRRIALLIGLLAAFYAGLFIWDGWLFAESLYIFCQTFFLFALARLQQGSPWKTWGIVGGIALGAAALTRPNGALLLGLLCLWAAIVAIGRIQPWRLAARNLVVIALVAIAINLPWSLYTYPVTHSLLPESTVGTTLLGAYNDTTAQQGTGIYALWWLSPELNADIHDHSPADEKADVRMALAWIRSHPDEMPGLLAAHLGNMWIPFKNTYVSLPFEQFPDRPTSRLVRDVLLPDMSYAVFALAALGLLLTWRRKRGQLLGISLVIALTIVQNVAFYGSPRFRAPIEPFLVILAGGVFWWLSYHGRDALARLRAAMKGWRPHRMYARSYPIGLVGGCSGRWAATRPPLRIVPRNNPA